MLNVKEPAKRSFSTVLIISVIVSLVVGGLSGYSVGLFSTSDKISNFQNQLEGFQVQIGEIKSSLSLIQNASNAIFEDDYANFTASINFLQNQLLGIQEQLNEIQAIPNTVDQNITSLQFEITSLQSQLSAAQAQIISIQNRLNVIENSPSVINQNNYQNITYVVGENFSLSQLFDQVKTSVVVVKGLIRQVDIFGRVSYSQVQGSGFVYNYSGNMVILTNNHVVSDASNITVTFTDGVSYDAAVLGSNANADFAVLSPAASISSYMPLEILSSSTLKVGDPVIVVGTPYGLAGSMSNGIVSALNRTLITSTNTEISNVIQTTAPLNPGNSGGPLMNYRGQVVGIATAIVQESQGIGFAIPSDTILSELQSLPSG